MNNQLDNNTVADGNTPTVDTGNPIPQEAGKTFTQEQVNAFVQDRLTRERAKYADMETRATLAERRLIAYRNDIPEDMTDKYIKLADLYPDDDFDKSIKAALVDFPIPRGKGIPRIVAPATRGVNNGTYDPIREGMGLNRKE